MNSLSNNCNTKGIDKNISPNDSIKNHAEMDDSRKLLGSNVLVTDTEKCDISYVYDLLKNNYKYGSIAPVITKDELGKYIDDEEVMLFCARKNSKIVGFVSSFIMTLNIGKVSYTTFLCVEKNERKLGISRLLARHVTNECKKRKIRSGYYLLTKPGGLKVVNMCRPLNAKKCNKVGLIGKYKGGHSKMREKYKIVHNKKYTLCEDRKVEGKTSSVLHVSECRSLHIKKTSIKSKDTFITFFWKEQYIVKGGKDFMIPTVLASTKEPSVEELNALYYYLSGKYFAVVLNGIGYLHELKDKTAFPLNNHYLYFVGDNKCKDLHPSLYNIYMF